MLKVTKIEHHRVNTSYTIELTPELLAEIYPDLEEIGLLTMIMEIESGEVKIENVMEDAALNGVDLNWQNQKDDWWTVWKGGYDVTYKAEIPDD